MMLLLLMLEDKYVITLKNVCKINYYSYDHICAYMLIYSGVLIYNASKGIKDFMLNQFPVMRPQGDPWLDIKYIIMWDLQPINLLYTSL